MELMPFSIGMGEWGTISVRNRYIGTALFGKSGTGKTAQLLTQWQNDCYMPYAKVLIESTGNLARDAYSASRGKAQYCSINHPISMNPLESDYNEDQICDTIIETIDQFVTVVTPNEKMSANQRPILISATKECLKYDGRKNLTSVLDVVKRKKSSPTRNAIIDRLEMILSDRRLDPIICGPSPINWNEFTRKGQSLIVDCSGIGKDKMVFLGSLVTHGLAQWFRYTGGSGKPIAVFVDEFQNFINPSVLDIIHEGRQFKIGIVLSTQNLSKFDKILTRSILNIGNIICFRVGHREADLIGKELCTDSKTLQTLPNYHVAVMNDQEIAIVKTSSPPYLPKIKPQVKPKVRPARWFTLEPYLAE
jgi:type IV secretory pathway VirB4 component